jgi:hypothetical protein
VKWNSVRSLRRRWSGNGAGSAQNET